MALGWFHPLACFPGSQWCPLQWLFSFGYHQFLATVVFMCLHGANLALIADCSMGTYNGPCKAFVLAAAWWQLIALHPKFVFWARLGLTVRMAPKVNDGQCYCYIWHGWEPLPCKRTTTRRRNQLFNFKNIFHFKIVAFETRQKNYAIPLWIFYINNTDK